MAATARDHLGPREVDPPGPAGAARDSGRHPDAAAFEAEAAGGRPRYIADRAVADAPCLRATGHRHGEAWEER
jgi:hypothetical protein